MKNYNNENNPEFLNNYLVHIKLVKMLSERTIEEYYLDTRMFLKYICNMTHESPCEVEEEDISGMTAEELRKITISDIYNFIFYTADERHNSDKARYRKISALRSFFKYLSKTAGIIKDDPMNNIEIPVPKRALPKYLSLDESRHLLDSSDNGDSVRDYCILTLFLNCGMRLSELVGINISDIDFNEFFIKVLGKGNKERIIYLNPACVSAIESYLEIRLDNEKASDEPALFLSNRNKRISKRRVQQIVEESLDKAGLGGKGITTHKLRHTAATLMYQYGETDILTLKEVLGHSNISTTEIYTHLAKESTRNAVNSNPLAEVKKKK